MENLVMGNRGKIKKWGKTDTSFYAQSSDKLKRLSHACYQITVFLTLWQHESYQSSLRLLGLARN